MSGLPCILLAGGRGTRLADVVNDRPKPMADVAGRPFIEWVMDYFADQGVSRFIVSAGYMADYIARYMHERTSDGKDIAVVTEAEPLGTGGAVLRAAQALPEDGAFIVSNADSLLLADLKPAYEMMGTPDASAVIVGRNVPDASRYGTLAVGAVGRLTGFSEKTAGTGLINGGIYLFKRSALTHLPKHIPMSLEKEGFPSLIAADAGVYVTESDAPFIDIGVPDSFRESARFIMRNGVSARDV